MHLKKDDSRLWRALTIAAALLALLSVGLIVAGDAPLAKGQTLVITAPEGETLVGTYYPGEENAGVLLLEGFGSDQVTMRSIASELARAGLHVLTCDFSGHGRSPGALTFDNAATDRLARQVLAAKEAFKAASGLADAEIILLGHSMGARVGLQAATLDPNPVAGLVLLGTQVNLATNVQSEVFTGIRDADLAWVQRLGPDMPPAPILLISGRWDDILTPAGADLLRAQLTDDQAADRELVLIERLLHNYEVFSPRALRVAKRWIAAQVNVPLSAAAPTAARRIVLWITGWLGLMGAVLAGERWAAAALPDPSPAPQARIANMRRFLWAKLWLWPVALPLMALVFALYWFVPLGTPVFNLTYVGFIGGYGLLMALLYALGRMPGVTGRFGLGETDASAIARRRWLLAGGVSLALLGFTAAYARTGWFHAPPVGTRLLWVLLFIPPTALGFRIGHHEARMLAAASASRRARWALTAVGLLPFFLWTAFQAALGSLSGMVGGVQGLLILALVLAAGDLLARLLPRPWLVALVQAALLYWLVLPQGVLFQ